MTPAGRGPALAALALAACVPSRDEWFPRSGGERVVYRRAHRAYDGAPPVVPHAVEALGRQECLNCHRGGMDLGAAGLAPRTPHPERVNCRQCHVEELESADFRASTFVALRHATRGARAYAGAPPSLPHPRHGRENCIGCHDRYGGSPLRTPHPDRVNCLQCHVEPVAGAGLFRDNTFGERP
jgi:cytochrome c-type protein NapB